MDFEELKQQVSLKRYAEEHLNKTRSGMYVCPFCHSGEKENKTGAFSIMKDDKGNKFHCFRCEAHGDIYDLVGIIEGIEDKAQQFKRVSEIAGVEISSKQIKTPKQKTTSNSAYTKKEVNSSNSSHEALILYRSNCQKTLQSLKESTTDNEAISFLSSRGYDIDTAIKHGLGYDKEKRAIYLPWKNSNYYYTLRHIDKNAKAKYTKPASAIAGKQPVYNAGALSSQEATAVVFICEGVFDALAIEQAGYEAIALGGTGYRDLVNEALERHYKGYLVPLMDNDKAGYEAIDKFLDETRETALKVYGNSKLIEYLEGIEVKDPAEAYQKQPKAFREILGGVIEECRERAKEDSERAYRSALDTLQVKDLQETILNIYNLTNEQTFTPTGIKAIDEGLEGISQGLYILGAISSLGKTTLALQIADNLAEQGEEVLFVTIEQSAEELQAKSLSRIMKKEFYTPVHASAIRRSDKRKEWDKQTLSTFYEACKKQASKSDNMYLFEGTKQPTVRDIRQIAETISEHKKAPIIFIDYLQLLAPMNENNTDKRTIDENISALRQLARDLNTTVFVISSLNRGSYNGGISSEAFKESGAIEYGSDVLLGLQPAGIDNITGTDTSTDKAKKKAKELTRETITSPIRDVELVVLKNRNGMIPKNPIRLTFTPAYNLYE